MAAYWECYRVAGLSPDDPRVAPLNGGDFARLPPALVHVAEFDPLRDEGEAYAAALTAAGVRAELTVHAGLIHHFYGLGGVVPAAQAAFERVCDGLQRGVGRRRLKPRGVTAALNGLTRAGAERNFEQIPKGMESPKTACPG